MNTMESPTGATSCEVPTLNWAHVVLARLCRRHMRMGRSRRDLDGDRSLSTRSRRSPQRAAEAATVAIASAPWATAAPLRAAAAKAAAKAVATAGATPGAMTAAATAAMTAAATAAAMAAAAMAGEAKAAAAVGEHSSIHRRLSRLWHQDAMIGEMARTRRQPTDQWAPARSSRRIRYRLSRFLAGYTAMEVCSSLASRQQSRRSSRARKHNSSSHRKSSHHIHTGRFAIPNLGWPVNQHIRRHSPNCHSSTPPSTEYSSVEQLMGQLQERPKYCPTGSRR